MLAERGRCRAAEPSRALRPFVDIPSITRIAHSNSGSSGPFLERCSKMIKISDETCASPLVKEFRAVSSKTPSIAKTGPGWATTQVYPAPGLSRFWSRRFLEESHDGMVQAGAAPAHEANHSGAVEHVDRGK